MDSAGKRPGQYVDSPDAAKKLKRCSEHDIFRQMLNDGGCQHIKASQPVEVEDPRELKRSLQQSFAQDSEAAAKFTRSFLEALQDNEVLESVLSPMIITDKRVPETGDSLMRLMLNISAIQTPLASALLNFLPQSDGIMSSHCEDSISQLLLGSLRWLDEVFDAHTLTQLLLEVMPKCSRPTKQGILELLPELVLDSDCEAVTAALLQMTEHSSELLLPTLEAISNISPQDTTQAGVTEVVAQRFQAAELADVPALLRFLLQHITQQNATQVVELLRCHMPPLSNARLPPEEGNLEEAAVEAMRTGLQCSHLAADTAFNQIKAVTEGEQHGAVDLWLLILLASLAAQRCEAVHKLLKKKFAQGHADTAWLDRALTSHQGVVKGLWPELLCLAGRLIQSGQGPAQAAGGHLYTLLFTSSIPACPPGHTQQEVLGGLRAHLGSRQAGEVTAALQVVLSLSHTQPLPLLHHPSFLGGLLDPLDRFTHTQLHQVFEVVSQLVVTHIPDSDASEAEGHRRSLSRRLEALLDQHMRSGDLAAERIGIIGTIKLVERLATPPKTPQHPSQPTVDRSAEAQQLLSRSFEAKQQSPAMFALLCDELTEAVKGGRLGESLTAWLRGAATDELEGFLDDCTPDPPPVQCNGGESMAAASWMNLNGTAGQVMLPVLRILASPDQQHRQSLVYLCAVTRLALALELQSMGNLEGLSAILGCPLLMPHIDLLHKGALMGLNPEQQGLVCSALLLATNWLRELVNAWAHHVQPQGCEGGAEVQQNLLVRLQNLTQLQALLANTLAIMPSQPNLQVVAGQQAPVHQQEKSQVGKGKAGRKAKAAVTGTEDSGETHEDQENVDSNAAPGCEVQKGPAAHNPTSRVLSREAKAQLRPLELHVLLLLGQVQCTALPQAALAPAAFLLDQLHDELVQALTLSRRPAFLKAASQEPASGKEQTPQQIWGAMEGVLPALQTLLTNCNRMAHGQQSQEGIEEEVFAARVEGASQDPTPDLLIMGHPAATVALAPAPAAARVVQQSLHCFQQLTASDWLKESQYSSLLRAFLRTFGQQPQGQSQSSNDTTAAPAAVTAPMQAEEVIKACVQAGQQFRGLSRGAQGILEQETSLLHIQANLISIAESVPGDAHTTQLLAQAKGDISQAGEEALKQGSEQQSCSPSEGSSPAQRGPPPSTGGVSWKGQQGVIPDLVHLWVAWSPSPCQTLLGLLQGALTQVPSLPLTGKKAQEPAVYPGLCGASLHVWYKAASQELLQEWTSHATAVVALHKRKQGLLQQEAVQSALEQFRQCSKAFSCLLHLNKTHIKRIQLHAQALRCGSKLIQQCLRALPFWQAWYAAHPNQVEPFTKAVKELQAGTRILYVICAEGKANKNITIANLVVGTKHVLEQFRVGVTAVMVAAKQHISQGNLKHKDLTGQEVSSQVPFTQVLSDDEDVSDQEQQAQDDVTQAGSDTD